MPNKPILIEIPPVQTLSQLADKLPLPQDSDDEHYSLN